MQNVFSPTVLSPFVNVYQTQLAASRRFADAIFSGAEKIDRVVIDATHRAINQQISLAQAMTNARDPQSIATTLQSNFLSRSPDDMNYQKEIMRIVAQMQNDIGRSLHEYIEQLGTNAASTAAMPLEAAQGQANDAMYNPMTSMFSVWESAFKEVAALAKKNMVAARTQVEDAANRTLDSATAFTGAAADSAIDSAATANRAENSSGLTGRGAVSAEGEDVANDRRNAPSSGRRK